MKQKIEIGEMIMEHSRENLEMLAQMGQNEGGKKTQEQSDYTPRPKYQQVLAWIAIAIVVLGFLGTCYWMVNF